MSNEINLDFIRTNSIGTIHQDEEIEVRYRKISEVDKKNQISFKDEDTTFEFTCEVKNDLLVLKLEEIGTLCPFIYKNELSKDDMEKIHSIFKACENLGEIESHIEELFKNNSIWLTKEEEDSIGLNMKIMNIAKLEDIKIDLKRLMTTDKDNILNELYKIQKNGDKVFKNFENYLKKNGLNDALNEFNKMKKNLL